MEDLRSVAAAYICDRQLDYVALRFLQSFAFNFILQTGVTLGIVAVLVDLVSVAAAEICDLCCFPFIPVACF